MELVNILETNPIDEYEVLPSQLMPESSSPFLLAENNTKLAINLAHVASIYRSLSELFFSSKSKISPSIMSVTSAMLILNPDALSAWNYRKRFLVHTKNNCTHELRFIALVVKRRPKSAVAWFHRRWVVECFGCSLDSELEWHSNSILPIHDRAYHSWTYRRYLIANLPQLVEEEVVRIEEYLRRNPKNASAISYYAMLDCCKKRKYEFCEWLGEHYPQFVTSRVGLKLLSNNKK